MYTLSVCVSLSILFYAIISTCLQPFPCIWQAANQPPRQPCPLNECVFLESHLTHHTHHSYRKMQTSDPFPSHTLLLPPYSCIMRCPCFTGDERKVSTQLSIIPVHCLDTASNPRFFNSQRSYILRSRCSSHTQSRSDD